MPLIRQSVRQSTIVALAAAGISAGTLAGVAASDDTRPIEKHIRAAEWHFDRDAPIDPLDLFDRIVRRYRDLEAYEDTVVIEQVTARDGQAATREETTVECTIDDAGDVTVTASSGFDAVPAIFSGDHPARSTFERHYANWLAPHLILRSEEAPLNTFRQGIEEGFTPVNAERITVDNRDYVRVDLQSGDGLSEHSRARFEIFIDPSTLLIQRVRGVQLLPNGTNLLTDYQITPQRVVTSDGRDLVEQLMRIGAAT